MLKQRENSYPKWVRCITDLWQRGTKEPIQGLNADICCAPLKFTTRAIAVLAGFEESEFIALHSS